MIDFRNIDCMDGMQDYPDKYFDLAIVDPPYGDGSGGGGTTDSGSGSNGTSIHKLGNAGRWAFEDRRNMGGEVRKKIVSWDVAPGQKYFDELFRVSRNQVIWGGELFPFTAHKMLPDMAQD